MATIKVPVYNDQNKVEGFTDIDAKHFAESAVENKVHPDDFAATIDLFSEESKSSTEQINKWRVEATNIYVDALVEAGVLKIPKPEDIFAGSSDYEENSEAALDVNK